MDVLAHNEHIKSLARLISLKKLPHALFFCGKEGIGKKLLAKKLAKSIFCKNLKNNLNSCNECKDCILFESENYPDYYYINCLDKEVFNTETIKKTLYSLNLKTYQGSSRFILFDNVENLNKEISNALLKILEEPPSNTYFCLIGSNTKSIPQTISSRCQVWHFKSLNIEEVREILTKLNVEFDESKLKFFYDLSEGSLKEILYFLKEKEAIITFSNLIKNIMSSNFNDIKKIIAIIKDNKEIESLFLSLLRGITKKNMRKASFENERLFWSNFLKQIIYCDTLRKRNVNQGYLYNLLLSQLVANKSSKLLNLEEITL